jgi:hypothetical protein
MAVTKDITRNGLGETGLVDRGWGFRGVKGVGGSSANYTVLSVIGSVVFLRVKNARML